MAKRRNARRRNKRCTKKVNDEKDSTQQSNVVEIRSEVSLGRALVNYRVVTPQDNLGCHDGNMVPLAALSNLLTEFASHDAIGRDYRVLCCMLAPGRQVLNFDDEDDDNEVRSKCSIVLLVHVESAHYSLVIVNPVVKVVHVFDTAFSWTNEQAWGLVKDFMPSMRWDEEEPRYRLDNHTRSIRQRGLTCGSWCLWLSIAYVCNYNDHRAPVTDELDIAGLAAAVDPVAFWRVLTV